MIREDAQGKRLARSTVERDWWGNYRLKTEQTRYGWEQDEGEKRKKKRAKPAPFFRSKTMAEKAYLVLRSCMESLCQAQKSLSRFLAMSLLRQLPCRRLLQRMRSEP